MDGEGFLIDSAGEQIPISGEVVIGRSPGVELWLDDPAVSRRHAIIRKTGNGFQIEDLHSANGTLVNDVPIEGVRALHSGDRLKIGAIDLTFIAGDVAEGGDTLAGAAWQDEETMVASDTATALAQDAEQFSDFADGRTVIDHDQAANVDGGEEQTDGTLAGTANADSNDESDKTEVDATALAVLPPEPARRENDLEPSTPLPIRRPPVLESPVENTSTEGLPRQVVAPSPSSQQHTPNLVRTAAQLARLAREQSNLAALLPRAMDLLAGDGQIDGAGVFFPAPSASGQDGDSWQCGVAAGRLAPNMLGASYPLRMASASDQPGPLLMHKPEDLAAASQMTTCEVRSLLVAPVVLRDGHQTAILLLLNPLWKPDFDEDDLDFATVVAQQLAGAAPDAERWAAVVQSLEPELVLHAYRRRFITADPELMLTVTGVLAAVGARRPVYLWGEEGTGRRHLATIATQLSCGAGAPFLVVDLASIPAAAQPDALFAEPNGAWQRAAAGTLLLEHAGDLDAAALPALTQQRSAPDVPRLVFSGEHDLDQDGSQVERELLELAGDDRYHLPPLRDRPDDIPLLARHFLKLAGERYRTGVRSLDPEAERRLRSSDWQRNCDILNQLMRRCVIFGEGSIVDAAMLADLAPERFGDPPRQVAETERLNRVGSFVNDLVGDDARRREAALTRLRALLPGDAALAARLLVDAIEAPGAEAHEQGRRLVLLGRLGEIRTVSYIATFLDAPDPWPQRAAIIALGQASAPEWVRDRLRAFVAGADPLLQALAILELGRARDLPALGLFELALQQSRNWQVRTAIVAAARNFDTNLTEVRSLLAHLLESGDRLPRHFLIQARQAGVLSNDEIQRRLVSPTLDVIAKLDLIQLVSSEAGATSMLAELASLQLEEPVQNALAAQIAEGGAPAIPSIIGLIGTNNSSARAVGVAALRQLAPSDVLASALRALLDQPDAAQTARELLARRAEIFSSLVAESLDAVWDLDSLVDLLNLAATSR